MRKWDEISLVQAYHHMSLMRNYTKRFIHQWNNYMVFDRKRYIYKLSLIHYKTFKSWHENRYTDKIKFSKDRQQIIREQEGSVNIYMYKL